MRRNLKITSLILLLASCRTAMPVAKGRNLSKYSSTQQSKATSSADYECVVGTSDARWQHRGKSASVSIKIQKGEPGSPVAIPSLHLMALPKKEGVFEDEYWAPFSLTNGATIREWQRLEISGNNPISIQIHPATLLWSLTKSSASMWPIQSFGKAVPPGRYALHFELEIKGQDTVSSNEAEVEITK